MAASRFLMVEPKDFTYNPQTASDNFFVQTGQAVTGKPMQEKARSEFLNFHTLLIDAGIDIQLFSITDNLQTPDALFPNNWFSTDPFGNFFLYPMKAMNRRNERRKNIIEMISPKYKSIIDLTGNEQRELYLEGTGSLVLDHENRIAYASLSDRTSNNVVFEWSKRANYLPVIFTSFDKNKKPVYHTNVVMSLADKYAVVSFESIHDSDEIYTVRESLNKTGHEIVEITLEQMQHFCGNCLQVMNRRFEKFLVMSSQAYNHFTTSQIEVISQYNPILHSDLTTIEQISGGSARCMLAELY